MHDSWHASRPTRVCSLKIRQFVLTLKRKRIRLWFECRIENQYDLSCYDFQIAWGYMVK